MKSLKLLSWNIENLGQSSRQQLQSLPALIANLAVRQQTDMIILLNPRPAPAEEKGLTGALKRKVIPGSNPASVVRNIVSALNRLENLPDREAAQKFRWRQLEIDPAFRPEDLPRSLTATVTGNERTGVQLQAGIFSHGARPDLVRTSSKSGVKEVEKAAVWDSEVRKVQTLLGNPNWRPVIPSPKTPSPAFFKRPGSSGALQQIDSDFSVFYTKKCLIREVRRPDGALISEKRIFTYTLKNQDFSNPGERVQKALESVRKVLTDLGVIKANADTYQVLLRALEPSGDGAPLQHQVVSIHFPAGSGQASYRVLPVLTGNKLHFRWLGLDGNAPGAGEPGSPANGRAPGLLNTWWNDHYLPIFLAHFPFPAGGGRQFREGFRDLSTLEVDPAAGTPVSLTNAPAALLLLDLDLSAASLAGGGPGNVLRSFVQKGRFKSLPETAVLAADANKTALIDLAAYLEDPASFENARQFRADAFDQLLFKSPSGITPLGSEVLDVVELFFWGCLYRLSGLLKAGRLTAEALPNLISFIGENAAEVDTKGAILPIDLFCLLGKTPPAGMTPQELLGDAFLAYRSLVGRHLPVLTSFQIN